MSADVVIEDVPKFKKRSYADQVFRGSNNTLIVLGTDRAKNGAAGKDDGYGSPKSDGEGKKAGAIYIAAGLAGEDPNLKDDQSYIYLSMKTDVDTNTGLENIEQNRTKIAAAILKSDGVRIVFRKDLKISHDGAKHYIYLDDQKFSVRMNRGNDLIKLTEDGLEFGENPSDHMALASLVKQEIKSLRDFVNTFVTSTFNTHTHPVTTSGGPTSQAGNTTPPTSGASGPQDVNDVKSSFVKSK